MLVFSAGYFVQVLEGQLPNIEPVFERIQRDERHDDIRIVDCAAPPRRAFAEWAMGYEQAPEDSALARAISFDPSLGGSAPHPADLVSLIRGLIDGRAPRVAELANG